MTIRRQAGRQHEGPRELVGRLHGLDDGASPIIAGELAGGGHMGDHGQARLAADLHDGVHMPVRAHPVGMGGADGADAGGAPLQLPALQSQRDGIAIGIAGDELQPHAREVAQEDHGGVVGRAGGGAAHLQLRTIGPHEVGE